MISNKKQSDFLRVDLEIKSLDEAGHFVGYAAIFDEVDLLHDICLPGCFDKTIQSWQARGTMPRVRWAHGRTIGHITGMAADNIGLRVEGVLWMDDPGVIAAYADIKNNVADIGMSFGFYAEEYEIKNNVRSISILTLLDDITLTLNPVNRSAGLVEVKSGDGVPVPSKRIIEVVLRDAGLSRSTAKTVLAVGYDAALREAKSIDAESKKEILDALGGILSDLKKVGKE